MIGDPTKFAMLPFDNQVVYEDDVIQVVGLTDHGACHVSRGTAFVSVLSGAAYVSEREYQHFRIKAGWYAAVPAPGVVSVAGLTRGPGNPEERGRALVVTMKQYFGLFSLGGPIERQGRLRYIDGCTDTGIILPTKQGDPCLNCLFFPAHTTQTPHTHPSHRVGLIVDGHGYCITEGQAVEMTPGSIFMIPTDVLHAFTTDAAPMRIMVTHPDSEVGPTDEVHQMLTATIIEPVQVP